MAGFRVDAATLTALYDQTIELLLVYGSRRAPAKTGPSGVHAVFESMGYQGTIQNPRDRLLRSRGGQYSPGQAAARFLYFLSGSDRRADIEPYTGSIAGYSGDGIAVGGSAHGVRLFHRVLGQSLFEHCLASLENDGESNRAVVPFFWPSDVGCGPKDAPCVLAVMPYRRENTLFMTVQMRAQEISRLFAYDIFEFTMLQELYASILGLELGSYTHGALALHYIEREATTKQPLTMPSLARSSGGAPAMSSMPRATRATRQSVLAAEATLRMALARGDAAACLLSLRGDLPAYWFDLVAAAAAHALVRQSGPRAVRELEDLVAAEHPVLSLELESIAIASRALPRD